MVVEAVERYLIKSDDSRSLRAEPSVVKLVSARVVRNVICSMVRKFLYKVEEICLSLEVDVCVAWLA